ncbi:MAG: 50S ribosomal protein L6, partial [Nanoarchaeota archaeon]|nr:50S ribosomal protein L6 [Nanoarchaeota archaeon]
MTSERIVDIPEGTHVSFEKGFIVVRGSKGELTREFNHPFIRVEVKDNKVIMKTDHERRRTLSILGTWRALIKNMIEGTNHGYEAKLKIVYSHFPVKFSIQDSSVLIQNFLGEKQPRKAYIIPGTEV